MKGQTITATERAVFLNTLAKTRCVRRSCGVVRRGKTALYALRRADPEFAADWDAALGGLPAGTRYNSDWERRQARLQSWGRYQRRRRRRIAETLHDSKHYRVWKSATPMQRWWLERFSLDEIHALARGL